VITYENQAWCSDPSGFRFQGHQWYLVTIMDIFTRQVIDATMGRHHHRELVLKTIRTAVLKARAAPSIFHSDQGTEFMAEACTAFLEALGTQISATDKASPLAKRTPGILFWTLQG
jgi:transposase InsO family protein